VYVTSTHGRAVQGLRFMKCITGLLACSRFLSSSSASIPFSKAPLNADICYEKGGGKLALIQRLANLQIDFPGAHWCIYLWALESELYLQGCISLLSIILARLAFKGNAFRVRAGMPVFRILKANWFAAFCTHVLTFHAFRLALQLQGSVLGMHTSRCRSPGFIFGSSHLHPVGVGLRICCSGAQRFKHCQLRQHLMTSRTPPSAISRWHAVSSSGEINETCLSSCKGSLQPNGL
jgi:hypothetical protein